MRFVFLPYILNPVIHDTITNTHRPCQSGKEGYYESLQLNEAFGEETTVIEGFTPRKFPGQE